MFSSLKRSLAAFLIIGVAFLAGCTQTADNTDQANLANVTDDIGREMMVRRDVARVVSLAPNLTEIIFAVGGGEKLVGVTTYCDFPAETSSIEKIGDTMTPNIEKIISLKPDIVFVTTASQLQSFSDRLKERSIAVYATDPNDLESIYRSIEDIGRLIGRRDPAEELVIDLRKRVARVESQLDAEKTPAVFVQIDGESLFTIGKEAFITDIIRRAGGRSVTADLATDFPKISKESALAMNPDAIIISESEHNTEPNEIFKNSNAVKNDRILRVKADLLSRPGPRVVDALEQIAKFLHPEKFK